MGTRHVAELRVRLLDAAVRAGRLGRLPARLRPRRRALEENERLIAELLAWDHEPEQRYKEAVMARARVVCASADRMVADTADVMDRVERRLASVETRQVTRVEKGNTTESLAPSTEIK